MYMFRPKKNESSSRELDLELKDHARTHFKEYVNDPISILIQEARMHLLTGLSRRYHIKHEDGEKSRYIYSSDRITLISDIAGNFNNDDQFISLWHLVTYDNKINTKTLANIIFALSTAAQKRQDHPPLKKELMTKVQHAIILILEAMQKGSHFPTPVMDGAQIFVAVAKIIDKENLPHLLIRYPELVKDIHERSIVKAFLQKESPQLLEAVEIIYPKLFPASSSKSRLMPF